MNKYAIHIILAFCCFLFLVPTAKADEIRRIEVVGAQRIEPRTILSYLKVEVGSEFSNEALDQSLKALYETGLFSDVQLEQDVRTLVVRVVENPIINQVAFEGNLRIEDQKLSAEIRLRPRAVFTKARTQADVSRIQEIYRRSGRFAVKVEPKIIQLEDNRVNLVFEIDEGPKTKIQRITFVNNKKFSDADLRNVIASSEHAWYRFLSSNDTYDPDRMEFDKELLRRFYLKAGYADIVVTSAIAELSQDRENFFLTFTLNEGERYKFGDIDIITQLEGVDTSKFRDLITTKQGEWFDNTDIDDSIEALTRATENQLFPFVRVVANRVTNIEDRTIDLTYIVQEGPRIFVDQINISGNVRTLDEVVRREFELAEGDPFNKERIRKSENNIRDLGFFETVTIENTPGSAPDQNNIDVTVLEQSTGELSIGAGFSTADGPLADFRIRERNFLGRGQELSLATTLAAERSEIDIGFVEPYFLNRDLRASVDVFRVTRDFQTESSFDQERTGARFGIGYPLSRDLRQAWSYSFVNIDISDVGVNASRFIADQEGSRTTSSIVHSLTYDKRNSRLTPTDGYLLRMTNEVAGLGGDAKFYSTELGANYHYSFSDDWIFNLFGRAGYIEAYGDDEVSINDRFFLGDTSFRGFAQAGIGPRDITTDDALGGNRYYVGTAEIGFPMGLPEEYGVKGFLFTDVGTLYDNPSEGTDVEDEGTLRASVGFGFSWDSPLGPIRVDLAVPVLDEEFDDTQVLSFNFGTNF